MFDGHDDPRVLLELDDAGVEGIVRVGSAPPVISHLNPTCLDRSCPNS